MARRSTNKRNPVTTPSRPFRCCISLNFRLYFCGFALVLFMGPVMYAVPYMSMRFRKNEMTSPEVIINIHADKPAYAFRENFTQNSTVYRKRVHYYNVPGWLPTQKLFKNCDHQCFLTTGTNIAYLDSETAIIFHAPSITTIPKEKAVGQIWIIHSMESPKNHHDIWGSWGNLINWTLGYRRDSDILSPYSMFTPKNSNKDLKGKDRITGSDVITKKAWNAKIHDAVWFVSKCKASSMRQQYATRLSRFIDIDIFGECGKFQCYRHYKSLCQRYMKKWYKFYLSFENSLCRDYITEKSFNVFTHNLDLIPVTRSGANESIYLPPGSYVTTNDFNAIQALGTRLNEVSNHLDNFEKYLQWKRFYSSSDMIDSEEPFCELCRRLHETDRSTKHHRLYGSIETWLNGNDDYPMCHGVVNDIANITDHK
ncbi:alpha-(1,3)-fucosyltransferase C-like [Ylistrum balloti]|uniref:alpha-(1,3)-fucosyltransferase C-like n=1 Tax=Ylistrum balloti TaxID=509963 RepID=UPI002905B461|nr:alpha-(1,3)-fucosyltransferase C-like [Ylistrum balloti]